MKYKVIANKVVMCENVTAIAALNMVCGIMQGNDGDLHVAVYYKNKDGVWCLENSFKVKVG